MHPEGASNCSWGDHRALLQFTYAQGSVLRVQVDLPSVLHAASSHTLETHEDKSVCSHVNHHNDYKNEH